jgi:hypothetical protein
MQYQLCIMNYALCIFFVLAVLFAALCPVRIRVSGRWEEGELHKRVDCVVLGRRLPWPGAGGKGGDGETSLLDWRAFFGEEVSQAVLEKLEVTLTLNAGAPWITPIAAGAAWGALFTAAAWLACYFDARFVKPKLRVQPVFYGPAHVSAAFDCILNLPLDHIIFILQRLVVYHIRKRIRRHVL